MNEKKILVVDDDKDFAQLLRHDLTQKGYQVEEAYDGEEGLKRIHEDPPDLVILDVRMPGLTGEQLVHEIHRIREGLPIIVVSAFLGNTRDRENLMKKGVRKVIDKKSDQEDLLAAIAEILGG
ncbi:MAG: response regulator [Candidatus Omnitrophica bacterium]|nr:response regulator [Candidatus Omnitrophota bacterium]